MIVVKVGNASKNDHEVKDDAVVHRDKKKMILIRLPSRAQEDPWEAKSVLKSFQRDRKGTKEWNEN